MITGTVRRCAGAAGRRRQDHDRADRRRDPQVRDEDRQEGRVHSDRPAVGPLQGHGRKGQARHRDRQHARQPARTAERAARHRRRRGPTIRPWPRRPPNCARRSTRASPQSRAGKYDDVDRVVQRRRWPSTRTARTASTTSATRTRRRRSYDKAEENYKKAIEVKPDYAEAYNGLANIYNAQRKFDQAAAASAKASRADGVARRRPARAATPTALYNQGVILWNAGKIRRREEAFEAGDRRERRTTPSRTTSSAWRS